METHRLVEDVKATDVSSSTSRSLSDMSLPVGVGLGTGTAIAIGSVLESCNEELFAPYTEGTKYLERESKSLGELFATFLERFTRYHV
jgi:pantoate kinase